jgi:hypothetical protein
MGDQGRLPLLLVEGSGRRLRNWRTGAVAIVAGRRQRTEAAQLANGGRCYCCWSEAADGGCATCERGCCRRVGAADGGCATTVVVGGWRHRGPLLLLLDGGSRRRLRNLRTGAVVCCCCWVKAADGGCATIGTTSCRSLGLNERRALLLSLLLLIDDEWTMVNRMDDECAVATKMVIVIVVKSKDLVLDKGDFTSNETLASARTRKAVS